MKSILWVAVWNQIKCQEMGFFLTLDLEKAFSFRGLCPLTPTGALLLKQVHVYISSYTCTFVKASTSKAGSCNLNHSSLPDISPPLQVHVHVFLYLYFHWSINLKSRKLQSKSQMRHSNDIRIETLVAIQLEALRCGVSTNSGGCSVRLLCLGKIAVWFCSFILM